VLERGAVYFKAMWGNQLPYEESHLGVFVFGVCKEDWVTALGYHVPAPYITPLCNGMARQPTSKL